VSLPFPSAPSSSSSSSSFQMKILGIFFPKLANLGISLVKFTLEMQKILKFCRAKKTLALQSQPLNPSAIISPIIHSKPLSHD